MTNPTPSAAADVVEALLSRKAVIELLKRLADEHVNMAIYGFLENAENREAMEAGLRRAQHAVAFMPAALEQGSGEPCEGEDYASLRERLVLLLSRFPSDVAPDDRVAGEISFAHAALARKLVREVHDLRKWNAWKDAAIRLFAPSAPIPTVSGWSEAMSIPIQVVLLFEPHPEGCLFELNGVRHLQRWGTCALELLAPSNPRDPDPTKTGIFRDHRCWKCNDGERACVNGSSSRCDYPRARND